ncbi:MAG: PmoA family protein [Chloroflexi bacterium]|nr:PmoA family protein [Chloroflexota bacterium]
MVLGLHHVLGDALAIDDGSGGLLATYHYSTEDLRSYFHPLAPPGAPPLTLASPHDHTWHTGMFFAWKFVDEVNFWEPGQGRVVSRALTVTAHRSDEVTWSQENEWRAGASGEGSVLLREQRDLALQLLDEQRYVIHWRLAFRCDSARRLHADPDRGYGGLGIRLIRDFQARPKLLAAGGQNDLTSIRGTRAPWAAIAGKYDATHEWASLVMFEHPSNPNFPAPVFLGKDLCAMAFLGSGFTFGRNYTIQPDMPLTLRYTVLVHRGEISGDECRTVEKTLLEVEV